MKTVDIAKDIVYLCSKYQYEYSNTKIQRLLFLFIGFALVNNVKFDEDVVLVTNDKKRVELMELVDEQPKAWPYGPVFSKVNHRYQEIIETATSEGYQITNLSEYTLDILTKTVQRYGKVETLQLSEWLTREGSPWDSVKNIDGTGWDIEIPLDLIREYFENSVQNILV